jgi:hypothetical protein
MAVISEWVGHTEWTRSRYVGVVEGLLHDSWHEHVYGANLGVRADAYRAVGGFHSLTSGEDRDLWSRLENAGYPLARPTSAPVRTSARTNGRASGGVAELLKRLSAV